MAAHMLGNRAAQPALHRATCGSCRRSWPAVIPSRQLQPARAHPRDDNEEDLRVRLNEAEAMQEALAIYQEAQQMAQQQVLQELMQMEISDMSYYQDDTASPAASSTAGSSKANAASDGSSSSSSGSKSTASASSTAPPEGSIRREPISQATVVKRLQLFWLEQGLQAQQAHSIAQEMVASGTPCCDITRLTAQVQRLGRVIPGRVQDMVARDWRVLDATPTSVAQHYVQLVQLFPATTDIADLAVRQPRLLYCDNLVGQFEAVVDKLAQLHPAHDRDEARSMLAEYPDLLFRMPYYLHVRTLDELPIEVQNLMVYTGQGLHHLHQLYSDSVSPRFL